MKKIIRIKNEGEYMKKALVVGGNSGIGLAITLKLIDLEYHHIYIVGKDEPQLQDIPTEYKTLFQAKTSFKKLNLITEDYNIFRDICDIDTLIITAGFGRVARFDELEDAEISNLIKCNFLGITQIIKGYYSQIRSHKSFYCAIMGSIAGHLVSPLFPIYGASKAGLCHFIENINAELMHDGYQNRILDISPGSIKGTNFNGQGNNLDIILQLANDILNRMFAREILYIPDYDKTYKAVLEKYHNDPIGYGIESYDYKLQSGRSSSKPQLIVGYLSGTFDLFHIGHLNLLRRAKQECDYLIVGVHASGAWKGKDTYIPFEERKAIVESIRYVDKVVESYKEDSEAYDALKFNRLFVGSDYKGTERFRKYEEYFKGKNVEIIYFPYTMSTSSTQLREAITKSINKK